MVDKAFEVDDPMELVGVVLPADAAAMRDMAYVFAEEFARTGFNAETIVRIFQHPFYAGAHRAYEALGEAAIRGIVQECTQIWGRVWVREQSAHEQEGRALTRPAPTQWRPADAVAEGV
jgi:hypothetical protein